jgi:hypothetical protein
MLRKLRIAWAMPVATSVLLGWPATATAGAQSACADLDAVGAGLACHFRSDIPVHVVKPAVYEQCVIVQGRRICRH